MAPRETVSGTGETAPAYLSGAPAGIDPDDPERPFRRLPRVLRRWSASGLWRRIRLPVRRRRWVRAGRAALAPYARPEIPLPEDGIALALGDFSGGNGLSRGALYELERLRAEEPGLVELDIAAALARKRAGAPADGPPIGRLYLLSAPDTYPRALAALPPGRIARARRTGLWVWETPRLSAEWRAGFGVVHEIWTPSAYSAAAIRRGAEAAGMAVEVTLRPHPVRPPATPRPLDRAALGVAPDAFLGLAIMDIRSCPARKNPWAHVAAWRLAFADDPRFVLVMKLRVSRRTRVVMDELAEMAAGSPGIRFLEREMEAGEIASLQAGADVFLSLHRAEGYGLNIAEALALGTPVVATDWSANAEYGPDHPLYRGVPARMVPYRDWTGHYPDGGFEWAEADQRAAAAALRQLAGQG